MVSLPRVGPVYSSLIGLSLSVAGKAAELSTFARSSVSCLVKLPVISPWSWIVLWIEGAERR